MRDGRCTKGYPKPFQSETVMTRDGYPIYARPDNGHVHEVRGVDVDNRWIVPYNPYLSSTYNCHINVECVVSFAAAKYICKYTHKGPDRASLQIVQHDEIAEYCEGHYISASEAVWRLLKFPIHSQVPNVVRLQVHLEGEHMVVFNPDEPPELIMERARNERTMLTAFFAANASPQLGPIASLYTYQEFPQHFVWHPQQKTWSLRKQGQALGRMFWVPPTAGERFYLRMLLTVVRGPRSWEELRTYRGVVYQSYRDACLARGLLESNDEWRQCLLEASAMRTGESLRRLFAVILEHCEPSQPELLWHEFREHLCDDLRYRLQRQGVDDPPEDDVYDFGLFLLDSILAFHHKSLSMFPSMPHPQKDWSSLDNNPYLAEQLCYNRSTETATAHQLIPRLNSDQRVAFDKVYASTEAQDGRLFFVHGPGGMGKTFLYQALCHAVRGQGWVVLCVASSGIAALLLPGGRTAHSTFQIPVEGLAHDSWCNIDKNSARAEMLCHVRLIIWDEAGAQHR